MADNTHIQWTEATWSPVTGCTKISDGCLNCYIDRTPPFRMNGRRFNLPVIGGTTGVKLHSDRLGIPVRWRKPRRIFVCSLADLFHTDVPDRFIADVFAVMASTPQHTYQVLTKRHARLRTLLNSTAFVQQVFKAGTVSGWGASHAHRDRLADSWAATNWPLPNVHVGVSAENQQWADIRIPALLDTPAVVRWVSAEPLLGPVYLRPEWIGGGPTSLDWLVAGGESGPGARFCDTDWILSLIRQCQNAVTAPFVKQLGSVWARDWTVNGAPVSRIDSKGGNWDHWPGVLKVREYPAERVAVSA